ncbi:hypothetical protein MPDQ_001498 [Monascus purpureus]|uniref:Protein required for ethanol metabolism n=1 Tax=Monascus purpureus TaxID=5098 RepID=A0A507R0L4_MONPU|nr:hypothetical protein MPDQ_001498 [Monascus purpureus]BDD61735.1 hypothetical protein MAP00_006763 [Monascus purpureus]
MTVPPIAKATLQSALINAGSNVLAQAISAYKDEKPFDLDTKTVLQFTACAVVISPLTFLWLGNLESVFPGFTGEKVVSEKEKKLQPPKQKLNIQNTMAKIIIDQTIGSAWYTVLFIVTMGALQGQEYEVIQRQVQGDFWPIMIAGFKLWPFVSLLNFTVVPADKRLLVGNLFGVVWAVYLSLMSR